MRTLQIERVDERATIPEREHDLDAGFDLRAHMPEGKSAVVPLGGRVMISTGLKMNIPAGYEIQIRSRSGLAHDYGIFVLNSPGTVDAGYRGEVKVILSRMPTMNEENRNDPNVFAVNHGDRIAQAVLKEVSHLPIQETDSVEAETERGAGGIGHTGIE